MFCNETIKDYCYYAICSKKFKISCLNCFNKKELNNICMDCIRGRKRNEKINIEELKDLIIINELKK